MFKMARKNRIALYRAADYDLKKSKEVVGPLLPSRKTNKCPDGK